MIEHVELLSEDESISLRAYLRFLDRGCEDGHDIEDWLIAESEVLQEQSPAESAEEPAAVTEPVLA